MLNDNEKPQYKKITRKEWNKYIKDYKTIIEGVPYILIWEPGKGTVLMPVEIV
jgi:hypothetical protein